MDRQSAPDEHVGSKAEEACLTKMRTQATGCKYCVGARAAEVVVLDIALASRCRRVPHRAGLRESKTCTQSLNNARVNNVSPGRMNAWVQRQRRV